jgi:hypothetical protein
VYINRVLRHWRETGMSQRLGGIVSYADDFVILCRSHRQARRSLEVITAWLTKVGLTIHPDKTRVCDAWEEPFDFLGYTFGVQRRFPTGTRFLAPVPSKKAQKRLKDRVKALLYRGNPTPWPELREELNRLIAGWANYFSFGWTGYADAAIHWHVAQQARRFLRKRHKLPRGSGRFSRVEVYGPGVGILEIWRYRKRAGSRTPATQLSAWHLLLGQHLLLARHLLPPPSTSHLLADEGDAGVEVRLERPAEWSANRCRGRSRGGGVAAAVHCVCAPPAIGDRATFLQRGPWHLLLPST